MAKVVRIIGIKGSPSKNDPNVMFWNYFYTVPFGDYDVKNAKVLQGMSCDSEFSRVDIGCHVGDEVELFYDKGFNGQANLVGCKIVKSSAPASK